MRLEKLYIDQTFLMFTANQETIILLYILNSIDTDLSIYWWFYWLNW